MSYNTEKRLDSIESAEPVRTNTPHVDAWELPDQARSIIARIAVVTGADAEDLVGKKEVLNSWAVDVDTILDILNIKWLGIPRVDDPRLGEWYLVPISPELAEGLVKTFSEAANAEAVGKRLSDEWVADRDRIRADLISEFLEAVLRERLQVDPSPGPEETAAATAGDEAAVTPVDVADYDFAYLPKYDKDLILSFAEMCGARDDLVNAYRFLEDEKFRSEDIAEVLACTTFQPAENLKSRFSMDDVELYEEWYVRAVAWFQEVLPGLLEDVDDFPPYMPPATGAGAVAEPANGDGSGARSSAD
jgi:hypothetical protein